MACCTITSYAIFAIVAFIGYKIFNKVLLYKKLNRWKKTPKDVVIVHGPSRAIRVPCTSPFVLKVETYLRMVNIPYKYDHKDGFGPRGKTPWISLNGEHVTDSQLIIEHLNKKFDKNLNSHYKDDKLSIATLVRITLEQHVFWGLVRWIFVDEGRHTVLNKMKIPMNSFLASWFLLPLIRRKMKGRLEGQGLGLHTKEDVHAFMFKDLEAVSKVLGNNKYLLGDEPCEDDAALFGFAAQLVWGFVHDSPEAKFVRDNHPNVAAYCERMKAKYWPDWENSLAK